MLIGIDLGTSACKVAAVTRDGEVVATARRDYPLRTTRPGRGKQDPADWWRATDETLTELTASLSHSGEEVTGIGLCGQMHGLTALDGAGAALVAGAGTGTWSDLGVVAVERTFVPEQRAVRVYDDVFARHRTLHHTLRPLFPEEVTT